MKLTKNSRLMVGSLPSFSVGLWKGSLCVSREVGLSGVLSFILSLRRQHLVDCHGKLGQEVRCYGLASLEHLPVEVSLL